MKISGKSVVEFKCIYEKYYKKKITLDEARETANRVMFLYEVLANPLPGEHNLTPPYQTGDYPSSLADGESSRPSS